MNPTLDRGYFVMSKTAKWPIAVLLLFTASGTLNAQDDRGTVTVTGTVTDQGGAVVPNAQVTATHLATNVKHKTTSSESGEFSLPSLAVGDYRVDIESIGFKTAIHQSAALTAGGTVRLNPKLELSTMQQSVEVTKESSALLQMDDGKLRGDIPHPLIQGLPTVPGSEAVDRGVISHNVTDGFSGAAPDLVALETGQAPPHYGPRRF
jgi:hypothetical protein